MIGTIEQGGIGIVDIESKLKAIKAICAAQKWPPFVYWSNPCFLFWHNPLYLERQCEHKINLIE